MKAALDKYAHFTGNEFPSFSQYESWLGADLMIKGLQMAGPTASHADVIKALRSIKSYNGNGLLPENINYTNDFGKDLPKSCGWYMKAEKTPSWRSRASPAAGPTFRAPPPSGPASEEPAADRGRTSVLYGDGVLGTGAHCGLRPARAALRGILVEDVEEIIVPDLEHLRGQAHAERVALAQIEINHNSHRSYLHFDPSTAEATRRVARLPPFIRPRTGRSG